VDSRFRIRETKEGVELALHVQPRAKKNEIAGEHAGKLKVRVTAPPVDDAANQSLVDFFAGLLKIPKSRVQITAGLHSREKTVLLRGITLLQAQSAIGVAAK
jgi:uncharacterized protein